MRDLSSDTTRSYVSSYLQNGLSLSQLVAKRVDEHVKIQVAGDTSLPTKALRDLDTGAQLRGVHSIEELRGFLADTCCSDSALVASAPNLDAVRDGDVLSNVCPENAQVLTFGAEVYLCSSVVPHLADFSEFFSVVSSGWHTFIALIEHDTWRQAGVSTKTLETEDLESMAKNVTLFVIEAWDGEGFLYCSLEDASTTPEL